MYNTKTVADYTQLPKILEILQNEGGQIEVESEEGCGTLFRIKLHADEYTDFQQESSGLAQAVAARV